MCSINKISYFDNDWDLVSTPTVKKEEGIWAPKKSDFKVCCPSEEEGKATAEAQRAYIKRQDLDQQFHLKVKEKDLVLQDENRVKYQKDSYLNMMIESVACYLREELETIHAGIRHEAALEFRSSDDYRKLMELEIKYKNVDDRIDNAIFGKSKLSAEKEAIRKEAKEIAVSYGIPPYYWYETYQPYQVAEVIESTVKSNAEEEHVSYNDINLANITILRGILTPVKDLEKKSFQEIVDIVKEYV